MRKFMTLLFVLVLLGTVSQSCKKQSDPVQKEVFDSGSYDPNSYFPLKWGAKWTYTHQSGEIELVECGPLYYDSILVGSSKAPYRYHRLSNSKYTGNNFTYEPIMQGKFYLNFRVGFSCNKGGLYSKGFMANGAMQPGVFAPSWVCNSAGPFADYVFTGIDSSIQLMNYPEVQGFLYTNLRYIESGIDTSAPYLPYRLNLPIKMTSDASYSKAWYAKGVGLIRRELYSGGQLFDVMELSSYSIPQ